jgi:16S rRNA (cytosine967-C5)-methyltransferase
LQPEEGEARIAAALNRLPLRRLAVRPDELPGLEMAITPAGDVRTLPCFWSEHGGMDGFFIARLERG